MTTPGIEPPEDVYVPGSGFGHQHRGMSMEDAKEFLAAPYKAEFGNLGDILMNTLNGILKAVVDGIVAGAQAVGFVLTTVVDSVVGAIEWVASGIAGLFGVGAPPAMTVGSTVADAYDKQQELIGKVDELMEDNAGFINLCMQNTVSVNWTPNKWMYMPFDTHVTEHKNADVAEIQLRTYSSTDYIPNIGRGLGVDLKVSGGYGIVFNAPGVWVIDGYVTTKPASTAFRYFEVDVLVYEVEYIPVTNAPFYQIVEEYTKSRFTYGTEAAYITSGSVHKPIIIPDDGKTYAAILAVRYQTERSWDVWGGARWTSLSAVRQSIDTTDYDAQDSPTGTVTVTE